MPVYEYACKQCEGRFEYIQRVTEPPREVCEQCGGQLAKLISNTSFVLRGGGWYKDGYAASAPKQEKTKAASTSPPSGESAKATEGAAAKKEQSTKTVGAAG